MVFPGLRILVVEDEQEVRRLICDLLRYWGCDVEMAVNGKEGIEKYTEFRPELVLMDLEMPLMNGLDASRLIMELDPQASILLITGFPETASARKALEQRLVKAVIPKPFELDQLKLAIQKAVEQTKAPSLIKVRYKLLFVLFSLSAKIEHKLEFSDEEARGLRDILLEISDDLHKTNW